MTAILDPQGNISRPISFEKESDFEAVVVQLADQIFGPSTIYIDVKKKMAGNDIITIPDGYVIDMAEPAAPKLFVVENEIVSHDPFKHIGIQLLKFVTSFNDAQKPLRNFLMEQISKDKEKLRRLEEGRKQSGSRNVDSYLDQAVYGKFRGLVVIDDARNELHQVLKNIAANISVLEVKTFVSESGFRLYQFDTLYDEDESSALQPEKNNHRSSPEARAVRRQRRASADTIIVPAREEGFKRVFLGENQWYEIRVGAAMKDRIKYIAAYQVAPISAITHIAEVKDIRPYKDTGKYVVIFKGPAEEIKPIPVKDPRSAPQGPVYIKKQDLLNSSSLEDAREKSS